MKFKIQIISLSFIALCNILYASNGDENKYFVAKYNSNGELIWQRNGTSLFSSFACKPIIENDGAVSFSFCSRKENENFENVFIKLNPYTNFKIDSLKIVRLTFSTENKKFDFGKPICKDKFENSYTISQINNDLKIDNKIIKCQNKCDFIITKYDKNHNLIWIQQGGANSDAQGLGIAVDEEGFIYISGSITNNNSLTKNPAKTINHKNIKSQTKINNFYIFPNPNNGIFNIEYKESSLLLIYNSIGKLINTYKLLENSNKQSIDLSNFAKGIYFIKIENETQKIIIE